MEDNKRALSSNGDERIGTFICVKSFAYGASDEIIHKK